MKFVRFTHEGATHIGALVDDSVVDLSAALPETRSLDPADMLCLIEGGEAARSAAERAVKGDARRLPVNSIRLRAPLKPGLILASGGNYMDHREEKDVAPLAGREPEFFFKTPNSVIGPGDEIELDPRVTRKLDYEVELAAVIGKIGSHIPLDAALDHVFGYTILNDVTARERQVRFRDDGSYFYEAGSSKNFDTSCPMGPYIATMDEIPDPQSLRLQTRVNGELRQNNTTGNMVFGVAELVSFFSTFLTLYPGYVIATGTPGGTAWASDVELGGRPYERNDVVRATGYLNAGDSVCCTVEGLGELCNTVVGVKAEREAAE